MPEDQVITHLNLIARMLEAAGYAIEVDYSAGVIIVWLDEWPIIVEVKMRKRGIGAHTTVPATD